jgi:alpha-tubulin suppressor-like RCC1 family protein
MAESMLLGVLGKDFGDGVFKYLAPRTLARLETTFTRELVFVPLGGAQALLLSVARRRHAEAAKEGAALVVLGEGRGGRATWAMELLWIYMAMGRARVGGAKKMISAGHAHSLVTSGRAGEIWSFGQGWYGRLGHGGDGHEVVPRLIEALNHVVVRQVTAGGAHSMVLTSEGGVFTWGSGGFGQLGHGNTDDQNVPQRVEGLTNVTDIAAGGYHSLAVGEEGPVYTWGDNGQGQLGLGDHGYVIIDGLLSYAKRLVPTEVPGVNEVVAVAAGTFHSFVLGRDGTAIACGANDCVQLGLGDTDNRDTFTVVAGLRGVVDIDAGGFHSIAVTAEGGLYTWGEGRAIGHGGDNTTQRLVPTKVTGGGIGEAVVVQVAAGHYHSMSLTAAGQLYAWGKGGSGQLGHGGKEDLAVPRVVDGIRGTVSMTGGRRHSLVTTAEGCVLAFGSNGEDEEYGQYNSDEEEELDESDFVMDGRLGLGAAMEEALTPTAIDGITMGEGGEEKEGKEGKLAESMLLGVLCKDFGDGVFKYLAPRTLARLEATFTRELVFIPLGGVQALLLSVARRRHAVAAKAGATLEVLGEGRGGRATWATELRWIYMAMGRTRVGGAKKLISAGDMHSLVTSGKIGETWSFGRGVYGKLGHGGRGSEAVPRLIAALNHVVVKQVAAGVDHSMVLTRDGDVFTWGSGNAGQLGHGNMDHQNVPKRVEDLTNVTDIAAGSYHSLAVVDGWTMYTWGGNCNGQLGLGDHGDGTDRLVPTLVDGVNGVVAVAAGHGHSFVLSRDGTVMACGENSRGELGLGDIVVRRDTFTVVAGLRGVVDIDAGEDHSLAMTVEGGLYTWGTGWAIGHGWAQSLVPTKVTGGGIEEEVVVQVAAGTYHSMALTASDELWTWGGWGGGDSGQLGHGGKEDLAVPKVVDGIRGTVSMTGGRRHSLVTTAEGCVLAFGSNGEDEEFDSAGEELDESVFVMDGRLGLGAAVGEALTPTAIDGITMGGEGEDGEEEKEGKE